jgi:hypothetical protein
MIPWLRSALFPIIAAVMLLVGISGCNNMESVELRTVDPQDRTTPFMSVLFTGAISRESEAVVNTNDVNTRESQKCIKLRDGGEDQFIIVTARDPGGLSSYFIWLMGAKLDEESFELRPRVNELPPVNPPRPNFQPFSNGGSSINSFRVILPSQSPEMRYVLSTTTFKISELGSENNSELLLTGSVGDGRLFSELPSTVILGSQSSRTCENFSA